MTKEIFFKNLQADSNDNHRVLLWKALECTKGDVVEFGAGWGSTEHLRNYCKENDRDFTSFDNSEAWAKLHSSTFIANNNWDSINVWGSVILIDHAPGERRWEDIKRLSDLFEIIVIHDSEPTGAGDYRYENIWHLFKYRADVSNTNLWATAVSNKIDLSSWNGFKAIANGGKEFTITA